jgi:hypothetical protein
MSDTALRPRRVLKVVLVTLAVATLGLGAVATIAWCSVFGCTLFSEDFEPHGEKATRARADATPTVAELADRASVDGRVIGSGTIDGCRTGQNDWKRKDTYSHECEVAASRLVVLATDRADVADGLTALDATLRDLGCEPTTWGGLDRVRDEYWRGDNPNVQREGAAGLPSARYDCPDEVSVEVAPTSASDSGVSVEALADGVIWLDDVLADDWYAPEDLRSLRDSDAELAVVTTATKGYYRTRF